MNLAVGDLLFDEDETSFRLAIRGWLGEHPPPSRPTDLGEVWMHEFMAWAGEFARAGYWALAWPKEFGGAELPIGHQLAQIEELALAQVDPKILMAGVGLVGPLLMLTGTSEQRARHLDKILYSRELWCMLLSEPGAGSDLAAVSTRAVVDGDVLRVTGQKTWASRAHLSDYGMLLCRTTGDPGQVAGLTMLILDLKSPGVALSPLQQLTGSAEFNEVYLDDVVVPFARTSLGRSIKGGRRCWEPFPPNVPVCHLADMRCMWRFRQRWPTLLDRRTRRLRRDAFASCLVRCDRTTTDSDAYGVHIGDWFSSGAGWRICSEAALWPERPGYRRASSRHVWHAGYRGPAGGGRTSLARACLSQKPG